MLTPEERRKLVAEALDSDDPMAFENLDDVLQDDDKAKKAAKATKRKASEASIQKAISKALQEAGWLVVRVNSMVSRERGSYLRAYNIENINSAAGHADLVVYKAGRAVFLEVKTATGRQAQSQKRFQAQCDKYGMQYHIVRSPQEAIECLSQN
jgi:hypothetical protein